MSARTYLYVVELEDGATMAERLDRMRAAFPSCDSTVIEPKGKNESRPQLKQLLSRIRPGDTLVFESLYSLGHNYGAIAENLETVRRCGGVRVILLDMPLLSGADPEPGISDAVIQTMLYIARHQKEARDTRQREGINSARERGVQFGRPRLEVPDEYPRIVKRWQNGEITAEQAAGLMNISRSTFFRRMRGTAQETHEETV